MPEAFLQSYRVPVKLEFAKHNFHFIVPDAGIISGFTHENTVAVEKGSIRFKRALSVDLSQTGRYCQQSRDSFCFTTFHMTVPGVAAWKRCGGKKSPDRRGYMSDWTIAQTIIFAAPFALLLIAFGLLMLMRKTVRTRFQMLKQLEADPDITNWLVVFGWTAKIIYFPTVLLSIIFFVLSFFNAVNPGALGAIWLGVFLLNFIVEEYQAGIKEILLMILSFAGLVLWLSYLNWLEGFWNFLGSISAEMNGIAYLLIALIFLLAIGTSWVKGLFHYAAFTPNYVNLQRGPTESGEQIGREEFDTLVDTNDLLERLLGFGSIIIRFHDPRKETLRMLVWGIGSKSRSLENIRGAITVDRRSSVSVGS
jgi:hypothetical protein